MSSFNRSPLKSPMSHMISPTNNSLIPIVTSPSIKSSIGRYRRADSVAEVNPQQLRKINDNLSKLAAFLDDKDDDEEVEVS